MSSRDERERTREQAGGRSQRETGDEARIPVVEERLHVERRPTELGEVQVRKTVTEEQQTVPVDLAREEVRVEQRAIDDRPATGGELFQEGTVRVPVRGEEPVVTKEAVVTGEVVIGKERTTERQEVRDTVRKERVEPDADYQRARAGFQQHFAARRGALGGGAAQGGAATFEEAEPHYRAGFLAGRDARYAGRPFAQIEPDLRRTHERAATGPARPWAEVR